MLACSPGRAYRACRAACARSPCHSPSARSATSPISADSLLHPTESFADRRQECVDSSSDRVDTSVHPLDTWRDAQLHRASSTARRPQRRSSPLLELDPASTDARRANTSTTTPHGIRSQTSPPDRARDNSHTVIHGPPGEQARRGLGSTYGSPIAAKRAG